MADRQQRSNREAKKPKKEKIKVIAAAPSQKAAAWQPTLDHPAKRNNPSVRSRDEDCSSPLAQIPACAANAPGSSLGSDVVR